MHQWHRKRVIAAFERIMAHESRVLAYLGCGSGAWVMYDPSEPGKFALRSDTCHDRWCPACGKQRAMVIRANLEPLLAGKTVRFITLTLKHDDDTLRHKLDRLHQHFSALRKLAIWTDHVDGGVAFLEVKKSDATGRWHPHYHIVSVGKFVKQEQLRDAWLAVTGDSHVVDIRVVKDTAQVAGYVTKYCTKPAPNELFRDDAGLDEAIIALKGRRLVTTFGCWRGTRLCKNDTLRDWVPLMPWPDLLKRCRMGDTEAIAIYKAITRDSWVADDTDVDDSRAPPF